MAWRFAQISDVHLGTRLADLSDDAVHAVRLAAREALARCFLTASEQQCQALLIPGDLFDLKGLNVEEQLAFAYEHAARYPGVKFLIAPGNADAYGVNCPYVAVKPPENVFIFTDRKWQTIEHAGAVVTSLAYHIGAGVPEVDWDSLPRPDAGQLSLLLLHATLEGAADGRLRRLQASPVGQAELLHAGYSYVALGHLHAHLETSRTGGLAAAAYAGPPQVLGWEEKGPGGFLLGELQPKGARLRFVPTGRHAFKRRHLELPAPYAERYRDQLEQAFNALLAGLADSDLLKLSIAGEYPETRRNEIEELVAKGRDAVFASTEPDLGDLRYYSGVDPLELAPDTLLSEFLKRCSMEAAQGGADPAAYEIARRLGWRLFTGQGLPAEISE